MYRHILIPCTLALAGSCVSYVADDADPAVIAAEVRARRGGAFTFAEAVATACRQNPELRALDARARAAGAALEPLELESEYRSGTEMLAVMLDPVALLNLGPRGGENRALDAAAAAAVVELATARWRVAGEVAAAFAVERALAGLTAPAIPVDADAFERAGLASAVDAARVRAAQAGATAEGAALHTERANNLRSLRRLLGLPMDAELRAVGVSSPHAAQRTAAALLTRPDLALATARFREADAEFRAAVAAQYPSLMIGPELPIRGGPLEWMGVLRLPLGAHGKARAAHARREAARAELEGAFLDASREASDLEALAAETELRAAAARAAADASAGMLRAALAAVEVDVDAFAMVAEAAGMAVRDAAERRMAELQQSRTDTARAVAYGWPAVTAGAEGGS